MLRSVIQISGKTHVVSLPTSWLRKYGIKKGDSLEVQEKESYLIVSPEKELGGNSITIDVSGVQSSIKRLLGAAYKAGYDEVQLIYESRTEREAIDKALAISMKTFQVIEEKEGKVRIKNLSELRHEEFEQMLRRMFLLLLSSIDDIVKSSDKNDIEILNKVIERDFEVNNCADFCRRSLNRKGYAMFIKTPPLYFIVEQLEKIGDIIRDIAVNAKEEDIHHDLCAEAAKFFREFYELYYSFDVKKFDAWLKMNDEIKNEMASSKKTTSRAFNLLGTMVEELFAMNGALLVCKLS
ncbi:MAG: PhoU domain-containing protein [Nanoarchaeota archaeon]